LEYGEGNAAPVSSPELTPNIWMGVSVEDHRMEDRIDGLRRSSAQVKFLSCEPLIGPLPKLDLQGIDWVIVGGESGRKPWPMKEEWVLDIQRQCEAMEIGSWSLRAMWIGYL
jgi:protein gp37